MNSEYWWKVGKGLLISVGGAALAYATATVIPALNESGDPKLLVVAVIASTVVNALQKMYFK